MSEERDHVLRDTEEDTALAKKHGRFMRKEEERAEAEEGPVYPVTTPEKIQEETRIREKPRQKKRA